MFLLYQFKGCNICEMVLQECYVNDLHNTTCCSMLDRHTYMNLGLVMYPKTPMISKDSEVR
jgi:hypothetical protein